MTQGGKEDTTWLRVVEFWVWRSNSSQWRYQIIMGKLHSFGFTTCPGTKTHYGSIISVVSISKIKYWKLVIANEAWWELQSGQSKITYVRRVLPSRDLCDYHLKLRQWSSQRLVCHSKHRLLPHTDRSLRILFLACKFESSVRSRLWCSMDWVTYILLATT